MKFANHAFLASALLASTLFVSPASAQLLNLGGGGGGLLGGSSSPGGTSVTVGGDSGSDGSVVDGDIGGNLLGSASEDNGTSLYLLRNGNGILGDDDATTVRLFGKGDDGVTAAVGTTLLNDDTPANARVNLFGNSGGDDVTGDIDLLGAGGKGNEVALNLFGSGDSGGNNGGGRGNSVDGRDGSNGDDGANGTEIFTGGGDTSGSSSRLIASAGQVRADRADCFAPDTTQIANLLQRNAGVSASFDQVVQVEIVPINVCSNVQARIAAAVAADSSSSAIQRAAAANATIRATLGSSGIDAGNVLSVDRSGGKAVVYVY